MPYSFADIEPVRGVCIASWRCDPEGNELGSCDESSIQSVGDIGIVDEIKKLSQAPRLISGIGHVSSITSDTRVSASVHSASHPIEDNTIMAHKLRSLMQETQQTFQALMNRNYALESEVAQLRARLDLLERRHLENHSHQLTPLPIGTNRLEQSSLNIYDISTPPTYKENLKPRAVARNRTVHDQSTVHSNRRTGSLTVFNS
jgi:hypothetical protein